MSLFRFTIRGAILQPANPTEQAWLDDLRARLRVFKEHCVIINEGEVNEEDITQFTYHICPHEEVLPCGPEQDI